MIDRSNSACIERLKTALDLADSGLRMKLAQLRRAHPDEDEERLRQRLTEWSLSRGDEDYENGPWRIRKPSEILSR